MPGELQVGVRTMGNWDLNSFKFLNLSSSGNLSHFHCFSQDFSIPAMLSWPKQNTLFKVTVDYTTDLSFFPLWHLVQMKNLQSRSKVAAFSSRCILPANMACETPNKKRKKKNTPRNGYLVDQRVFWIIFGQFLSADKSIFTLFFCQVVIGFCLHLKIKSSTVLEYSVEALW